MTALCAGDMRKSHARACAPVRRGCTMKPLTFKTLNHKGGAQGETDTESGTAWRAATADHAARRGWRTRGVPKAASVPGCVLQKRDPAQLEGGQKTDEVSRAEALLRRSRAVQYPAGQRAKGGQGEGNGDSDEKNGDGRMHNS